MIVPVVNALWVIAGPVVCVVVYGFIIVSLWMEGRRS